MGAMWDESFFSWRGPEETLRSYWEDDDEDYGYDDDCECALPDELPAHLLLVSDVDGTAVLLLLVRPPR